MPECTKCASKTETVAYLNDEYDRREFEVIQNVLENWTDGRSKRQHLLDCGQGRFFYKLTDSRKWEHPHDSLF